MYHVIHTVQRAFPGRKARHGDSDPLSAVNASYGRNAGDAEGKGGLASVLAVAARRINGLGLEARPRERDREPRIGGCSATVCEPANWLA